MKIHKEIVWNKGENPKKDGYYMLVQFRDDGSVRSVANIEYTVAYGWNTCLSSYMFSFGQCPNNGAYAWAELPF